MGNYADVKDAQPYATVAPTAATTTTTPSTFDDPYGGSSTQSIRRRGDTNQMRVGQDTRVRELGGAEGNMGDASAAGQSPMAAAMGMQSQAGTPKEPIQPVPSTQNAWQGTRTPVDLASIQQRVLQSLSGLKR